MPTRLTHHRQLVALVSFAVLLGAMAVATPGSAVAHHDPDAGCLALGGAVVADECVVSTPVTPGPGPFVLVHTLHVTGTGYIDASGTGITINVDGEADLDLIMDAGAVIDADDSSGAPNNGAGPITIHVTGDVLMRAGSRIDADNDTSGGLGGNITIDADGDMTMCGPAGAQPGCGGPSANVGALITSEFHGGNATVNGGGIITITVGDLATVSGDFYMEGGSTAYLAETGARVIATGDGESGDINITAGATYTTEPGSVVEAGDGRGNAQHQGGKIFLVAGCELTSLGRVTSKGEDPGADLIHLEGCEVLIGGLVESTGKAHGGGADNSCNNIDDGLIGEVFRPGKPDSSQACIEVWGDRITIDSTNGLAGELNADVGDGGSDGSSWIDVFALCCELTLRDGPGNDHDSNNVGERGDNNTGHNYPSTFLVHANSLAGSDSTPNTVTVKAHESTLTGTGEILQSEQSKNGSGGGTIVAEALGTVNLDASAVIAAGDNNGGPATPCTEPGGAGTCGDGGHISVRSFAANLSWRNGEGDVQPNTTGPDGTGGSGTTVGGTINLTYCTTIDITNTDFNGETPVQTQLCDGTKPVLPEYVPFQVLIARWALCGDSSVSGMKFNDLDGDGIRDGGELGLDDWTISLYLAGDLDNAVATTVTAGGGLYSFSGLVPAIYVVCETLQPGWAQTFPGPGTACANGTNGHTVDLTTGGACCDGVDLIGLDFGNRLSDFCEKEPVRTFLNGREPDVIVRVDLGQSVQAAVDAASDTNGDGSIIVGVSAHADGSLGGSANQSVAVSKVYDKPFALIGCSVTLTGGGTGPAVWIQGSASSPLVWINGRATSIFVMDLHGASSAVGVQADGTRRYLRNENAVGNGIGIKVVGNDNTVHNGAANDNTGAGVWVSGSGNLLTDTNSMGNGGNGFTVAGASNQLLKLDSGDRGKGNGGDGINVAGSGNSLSEIDAYANRGDGLEVIGNSNQLIKNVAGDRTKGNGGDGIRVTGTGNQLTENKARANAYDGFDVSGGTSSLSNKLKKNESNTGASGSDTENGQFEFRLAGFVKNDGGGNKADNIAIPKSTAPAKCATFAATNATTSVIVNCE